MTLQASQNDQLENLLVYVRQHERVCPVPNAWHSMYNLLPNKRQKSSGGWEPSLPLILGGWWHSSNLDKMLCLDEHIQYAFKNGVLDKVDAFLRSLSEEQWHHLHD